MRRAAVASSLRARAFRQSGEASSNPMPAKTVAIAGGSGFIGRAIARRLAAIGDIKVRVLTRNPDAAYERLKVAGVEFVRGDIADPATLKDSLAGASAIVDAVQFDGYPIENPRR